MENIDNSLKIKPFISVILVIYNVEKYLEECLDSLLKQTYKNFEIVCIDNGSTDKCHEVLQQYAKIDNRIIIHRLDNNKKLATGRNVGLDKARGEYICFVDPDDYVEKNYLYSLIVGLNQAPIDPQGNPCRMVLSTYAENFLDSTGECLYKIYLDHAPSGWHSVNEYNDNPTIDTNIPMWNRLYHLKYLKEKNIRFLDGSNIDNLPFNQVLLGECNYFYILDGSSLSEIIYHRRLITIDGALTRSVLFETLEAPEVLDSMFSQFLSRNLLQSVKVPFFLFFTLCFPRHKDQPRYFLSYKNLLSKLEPIIKSSNIYSDKDRNLCDLILYSNDFYDFSYRYFSIYGSTQHSKKLSFKLFGKINLFTIIKKEDVLKYKLFNLSILKIKKLSDSESLVILFGFIRLLKITKSDI